ncbi:MAG: phosphoribosylformimino-5-aminoimidazole carboxamide ribotide isomerase [Victivallaceae bacterium]
MMKFRPCIDLHDGKVKQIVGSSLKDCDGGDLQTNFESAYSPEYYAKLYQTDQLAGGHVIMLGPNNEVAAQEALAAWPGGLQLGGGVTDENCRFWLDSGAAQVILTSFVFRNGELNRENLRKIFAITGREHLVLDLSCRKRDGQYFIVSDRWQKFTDWPVNSETLKVLSDYSAEFLIHAVDVEGKQSGIDLALLEIMAEYSPIKCVYAGGIHCEADIDLIARVGQGKIDFTVGSALDIFGGNMSYHDLAKRKF